MMDLGHQREAILAQTFDHPDLPQRLGEVELLRQNAPAQPLELPFTARSRQAGMAHVVEEVEAIVVNPDGMTLQRRVRQSLDPSRKRGSTLAPLQGKSLVPLLTGKSDAIRAGSDWIGWELFGNRAVRQGDWKILYLLKAAGGSGDWQLFNLRDDPAELHDLSKTHPDKRQALLALWAEYVKTNGVILTGDGLFAKGRKETPATAEEE